MIKKNLKCKSDKKKLNGYKKLSSQSSSLVLALPLRRFFVCFSYDIKLLYGTGTVVNTGNLK